MFTPENISCADLSNVDGCSPTPLLQISQEELITAEETDDTLKPLFSAARSKEGSDNHSESHFLEDGRLCQK